MRRTLITLLIAVALLGTVVAGSATAQASPAPSTADAVETITIQPSDHDAIGGGGDTCSISPSDHDAIGGGC